MVSLISMIVSLILAAGCFIAAWMLSATPKVQKGLVCLGVVLLGWAWNSFMGWLRHQSWLRHRDSGLVPGTQHLVVLGSIGVVLSLLTAALLAVLL